MFLALPVCLFYIGWLKWYLALAACGVLVAGLRVCIKEDAVDRDYLEIPAGAAVAVIMLCALWVWAGGVGGWVWQRADWNARNAVFHDLINYRWPVVFEDGAGLTYYLCYWMIPALVGKIAGWTVGNIVLYIWTVIGVVIIALLLISLFRDADGKVTGGRSLGVMAFLILWGGLNLVGQLIVFAKGKGSMDLSAIYGWSEYQYTPNNGLLEWVFNQSVPAWICSLLFLHEHRKGRSRNYGLILMLLIPFAPFAAIGMAPLVLADAVALRDKRMLGMAGICSALAILPAFGAYYGCNSAVSGDGAGSGIINIYRLEYFSPLYNAFVLFVFLMLQVLAVAILIFMRNRKDRLFLWTVIWLLLIPLIKIGPTRDFMLRGSIVPLFVFMTYIVETLFDPEFRKSKVAYAGLLLATVVSFYSGVGDFALTAINTMDPEIANVADNLGTMNVVDNPEWEAYTKGSSYIVEDADNTLFFGKMGR